MDFAEQQKELLEAAEADRLRPRVALAASIYGLSTSFIQARLGVGITAAQDWCATAVHTKRRPWQLRIPMKSATDSGSTAPVFPIQTRHSFRSASATYSPRTCPHATCPELSTAAGGRRLRRTQHRRGGQVVFSAQDACASPALSSFGQARSMSAMWRIAGA